MKIIQPPDPPAPGTSSSPDSSECLAQLYRQYVDAVIRTCLSIKKGNASAGAYTLTVRTTDAKGSVGADVTYTLRMGYTPPTVTGFVAVDNPATFSTTVSNVTGNYACTFTTGSIPAPVTD